MNHLLISIAQCLSTCVEKIMESSVSSKNPYIDLKFQSHILPSIIKRGNGSADLV